MDWGTRADLSELMDDPARSIDEIRGALGFLRRVNAISLARRIIARHVKPGRILDVATGSADIPRYLMRRGLARQAVGLDISPKILGLAREFAPDVTFVRADARRMPFCDGAFDTAICHLFFHHLDEEAAVHVLREMARVAKSVVVVDLLRRRRLYAWVKLLTLFCANPLARFDGPVSVRRSFSKDEVERLAARAGIGARVKTHIFHRWSVSR